MARTASVESTSSSTYYSIEGLLCIYNIRPVVRVHRFRAQLLAESGGIDWDFLSGPAERRCQEAHSTLGGILKGRTGDEGGLHSGRKRRRHGEMKCNLPVETSF